MGIVLTYGEEAWKAELTTIPVIIWDSLTVIIFLLDIFLCLNCGYLYRGMIITDRKRIVARYLRRSFIIDFISFLIILICPLSQTLWTNWFKLWLGLKLIRISEIDDFYMRRFNIHRKSKAVYVIFKQVVLIFVLSHIVGLIFYAMDYYYLTSGYYPPDRNFPS